MTSLPVVGLWCADATWMPGEKRGAFAARLTYTGTDRARSILWKQSGRIVTPRDLPALVVCVRAAELRDAPALELVDRAKADGYAVRVCEELPQLPEPPPSKPAPAASAKPRRRRRPPAGGQR